MLSENTRGNWLNYRSFNRSTRHLSINTGKGKDNGILYSAFTVSTLSAFRYGSHLQTTPYLPKLPLPRKRSPDDRGDGHPTAAYYSFIDHDRMKA